MAPFPGVSYNGGVPQLPDASFNGKPMPANQFGQVGPPDISASSSVSSAGGFHPYRRTQRGTSDVGVTSSQNFPLVSIYTLLCIRTWRTYRIGSTHPHIQCRSQSSSRETSPMLTAQRKQGYGGIPPFSVCTRPRQRCCILKTLPGSGSSQVGLAHLRGAPPRTNSQSSMHPTLLRAQPLLLPQVQALLPYLSTKGPIPPPRFSPSTRLSVVHKLQASLPPKSLLRCLGRPPRTTTKKLSTVEAMMTVSAVVAPLPCPAMLPKHPRRLVSRASCAKRSHSPT